MTDPKASSGGPKPSQYFLAGILTIIPLGVTIFILYYLVKFLASLGKWPVLLIQDLLRSNANLNEEHMRLMEKIDQPWVWDILGVVLVIVLIYVIGVMTSNFIGRQLLRLMEWFLNGIPFVKTIYGAVKKLVDLVSQDPAGGEVQRVVLIEFPSPEMKTVGLVTRTFRDAASGRLLAAVYVPTTPNPTSGYLEIVPVDRIVSTDWTFDQAMSFIVSGGATAPETMYYDRPPEGVGKLPETPPENAAAPTQPASPEATPPADASTTPPPPADEPPKP